MMKVNYLLVNIDQYQDKSLNVEGTGNSAQRWKNIFNKNNFNEINWLQNKNATKENILVELTKLMLRTQENELAIFVFIGHGSKKIILEAELQAQLGILEDDNYDEVLFAHDKIMVDNELRNILNLKKPKAKLLLFFDACNANSAMNLQYSTYNNLKIKPKNELVFLASSNFEKAKIIDFDHTPYSIFSYYITEMIEQNNNINYYELFKKSSEKIIDENPAQHINLLYTDITFLSEKIFTNEIAEIIDEEKIKESTIFKQQYYHYELQQEFTIKNIKIK